MSILSAKCDQPDLQYFKLLITKVWYFKLPITKVCYFKLLITKVCYFKLPITKVCYFKLLFTKVCYFKLLFTKVCYFKLLITKVCYFFNPFMNKNYYSSSFNMYIICAVSTLTTWPSHLQSNIFAQQRRPS